MLQFYKAFKDIKKQTSGDRDGERLKASGNDGEAALSVSSYKGKLDTDWLEAIKQGLPHIEAAIREDRQFIKQEGTILPIERVKRVSRASVEHLAKHSELITKVPEEDEEIIPDKLSVYENLSNYTIYENRVLYMVLLYTRDFVEEKKRAMLQSLNTKKVQMNVNKNYKSAGKNVDFSLNISLSDFEEDGQLFERQLEVDFEEVLSNIHSLMGTTLMKEAANAPLVKAPITRTNILKMDVHFREVMELYDYLTKYVGNGVSDLCVTEEEVCLDRKLSEGLEDDLAEVMMLSGYLARAYSSNSIEELQREYEISISEEQALKEKRRNEQCKQLKANARNSEKSMEEYMLWLEEENGLKDAERLKALENTKRLQAEHELYIKQNESHINALNVKINEYKEMEKVYQARILALRHAANQIPSNEKHSDKESFLTLEDEYRAFTEFYNKTWKDAKKDIRKKHLWSK